MNGGLDLPWAYSATCLTLFSAGPAGAANGTAVQQFTCNGTGAQEWEFQPTSNGDFRVDNADDASKVWDVTNVSTADSAPIQLWAYGGGADQQWSADANGMVVNGQNVTAYGLFVEHYQQYQVIWSGNGGRTYFYQSEMPYDPPNQAARMNGSTRGFASYKVSNNVTSHQAFGLGIYCFFEANPSNVADHAIEIPPGSGIGTIQHVINNNGGTVDSGNTVSDLTSGP